MALPNRLYKFRPINPHTIEMFANEMIFITPIGLLNDPYEGRIINNSRTLDEQKIIKTYESDINELGIYSASDEWQSNKENLPAYLNPIMWSHYADSHRGMCIVIKPKDTDKIKWEQVSYSDEIPTCPTHIRDCEFSQKALSIKHPAWKYENEWRMVFQSGFAGTKKNMNHFFEIENIIIGVQCPNWSVYDLLESCSDNITKLLLKGEIEFCKMAPHRNANTNCAPVIAPDFIDKILNKDRFYYE